MTGAHVVNAGDGKHQHPTQALLDLYTIKQELGRIEGLHVAIVGDVLHSRVARSNIQALVLCGASVTLVGPPTLMPRGIEAMGCAVSTDIDAIKEADVVYVLRMQQERMLEGANYVPSLREYTARWGVTPERLRPGQKIMHPGPMNRGVEIDPRRGRCGRRADRDAGAGGPSPAWRCSTTCSPRAGRRSEPSSSWRRRDAAHGQGSAAGQPCDSRRARHRSRPRRTPCSTSAWTTA